MVSLAVAEGRMVICCRPAPARKKGQGPLFSLSAAHGISPFEVGEPSLHARPELR